MKKEACVETLEEAFLAEKGGADRIELCSHLELDGLTPLFEMMNEVCSKLLIPVMVMVRPRSGGFVYSEQEIDQMKNDIDCAKKAGAQGIVLGLLTPSNEIDIKNTSQLALYAQPLEVTFHKAFDDTPDLIKSYNLLTNIKGITRILTSGGKATAMEGITILKQLVTLSQGKPKIMAAGKVTDKNILKIQKETRVTEFHGRKIVGDLY